MKLEDIKWENTLLSLEASEILMKDTYQCEIDYEEDIFACDTIGFRTYDPEVKNEYRILIQYLLTKNAKNE